MSELEELSMQEDDNAEVVIKKPAKKKNVKAKAVNTVDTTKLQKFIAKQRVFIKAENRTVIVVENVTNNNWICVEEVKGYEYHAVQYAPCFIMQIPHQALKSGEL